MTCSLKPLRLTANLRSKIEEVLRQGHSLSVASVSLLPTASVAHICAPPEFDASLSFSLNRGGVCSQTETREVLVNIISDYLHSDVLNLVVFEDPLAKPTDELMQKTKLEWSWYQDQVYYFLSSGSSTLESIRATLSRAMDPLRFFALFTRSPGKPPTEPIEFQSDKLQDFIANSESIIVGIFDGESFMRIPVRHTLPELI